MRFSNISNIGKILVRRIFGTIYCVPYKEFSNHNTSPSVIFLHETVVKPRSVKMLKVAM